MSKQSLPRLIFLIFALTGCSIFHDESYERISECEETPYTVVYAGTRGTMDAEFSYLALNELKNIAEATGVSIDSELSIEAQVRIKKVIAANFPEISFRRVAEVHFCRLKEAYPDKKSEVSDAEFSFYEMLADSFDPKNYEGSMQQVRLNLKSIVDSAGERPALLKNEDNILPDENFTERTLIDGWLKVEASKLASVNGCLGVAFSNLSPMDDRTLTGLESLSDNVDGYLRGGIEAKLAVQNIISIPRNLYQNPSNEIIVKLEDLVCVKNVSDEILEEIKRSSVAR